MRRSLIIPALMMMVSGMESVAGRRIETKDDREPDDDFRIGFLPRTIDIGRRAEKDASALAKAQRKRERKAAKRAAALRKEAKL